MLAETTLYYFKNEKDAEPAGRIDLNSYTLGNAGDEKGFAFKLTPNGKGDPADAKHTNRTWVLQAENRESLVSWAEAIEHAFVSQYDEGEKSQAKALFTTFQVPLQSFNMLVQVFLPGAASNKLTLPYEMVRHTPLCELKQLFYDDAVKKNLLPKSGVDQYHLQVGDTQLVVADDAMLSMDDFSPPCT